jgi:hypothetical protein
MGGAIPGRQFAEDSTGKDGASHAIFCLQLAANFYDFRSSSFSFPATRLL